MNPYTVLKNWLIKLHEQFGDKIPQPNKIQQIVTKVENSLNDKLKKYLGEGDNGIAFATTNNKVIKYTIDKNEAILWNKLKNQDLPGIAKVQNILNLSSSITGDTYLYVIHVEYVAYDLNQLQKQQINQILKDQKPPTPTTRNNYIQNRTIYLINKFEDLSEHDRAYELIPDLLMDLADKHRAYIYDLRADNFKVNDYGQIILIDPSVPDLLGKNVDPEKVSFESKINYALETKVLTIYEGRPPNDKNNPESNEFYIELALVGPPSKSQSRKLGEYLLPHEYHTVDVSLMDNLEYYDRCKVFNLTMDSRPVEPALQIFKPIFKKFQSNQGELVVIYKSYCIDEVHKPHWGGAEVVNGKKASYYENVFEFDSMHIILYKDNKQFKKWHPLEKDALNIFNTYKNEIKSMI